jgi:RNA polymerase sigma-70 factor, ECF subfamily
MTEERALAERAVGGDRAAFSALVERHEGAVFGFLRARLVQASDAEDMTQEVFLRFFTSRARFDTSTMLRPWLLGIARNVLREHVRRRRRQRESAWTEMCLEIEDALAGDEGTYDDVVGHLPECLESLGPSARDAIRLKYRQEAPLKAIGEQLRRSEGAVKLLVYRARQALRNCLERKLRTEPGVR